MLSTRLLMRAAACRRRQPPAPPSSSTLHLSYPASASASASTATATANFHFAVVSEPKLLHPSRGLATGGGGGGDGAQRLPSEVDFDQFEQLRKRDDVTVLDVREPQELKEIGSIPGAVNVPLGEVERAFSLSEDAFLAEFGGRQPEPSDPVVTLCMKGVRAAKARDALAARHGYDNVAVYRGSYTEWAEKTNEK